MAEGFEFTDSAMKLSFVKCTTGRKSPTKKILSGVELSDKQVQDIKEAFFEFDIDRNGVITTQVSTQRIGLEILDL